MNTCNILIDQDEVISSGIIIIGSMTFLTADADTCSLQRPNELLLLQDEVHLSSTRKQSVPTCY